MKTVTFDVTLNAEQVANVIVREIQECEVKVVGFALIQHSATILTHDDPRQFEVCAVLSERVRGITANGFRDGVLFMVEV